MDNASALRLLGLAETFTRLELKRAFRELSLRVHPDVGGNQADFIEAMQAYNFLQSIAVIDEVSKKELTTVDGRRLSELGNGYPITVSAKTCERCKGRGYQKYHEREYSEIDCPSCGGSGLIRHPCKRCNGTGQYKHPKSGEVIGECRGCKGTGWFYPKNKRYRKAWGVPRYIPGTEFIGIDCKKCFGSGRISGLKETEVTNYVVCDFCKGVGEVKMANPVIPRGYLAGR